MALGLQMLLKNLKSKYKEKTMNYIKNEKRNFLTNTGLGICLVGVVVYDPLGLLFKGTGLAVIAKVVIGFHVIAYGILKFVLDDVVTVHFIHLYGILFG